MKVKYVGKQVEHKDRLYGSKAVFEKAGSVVEIDDEIAKKMVKKHPDQYAEATSPVKQAPQGKKKRAGE